MVSQTFSHTTTTSTRFVFKASDRSSKGQWLSASSSVYLPGHLFIRRFSVSSCEKRSHYEPSQELGFASHRYQSGDYSSLCFYCDGLFARGVVFPVNGLSNDQFVGEDLQMAWG